MNTLRLTGGTLIAGPGETPHAGAVLIIEDGLISYAGSRTGAPGAQPAQVTLDCSGATILPGFWNSHVHFFERKWANASELPADELAEQLLDFARFGFTTVFDLSSNLENTNRLRARIESGEICGPRVLTTGPGLVPPGALPPDIVNRVMGIMPVDMPMVSTRARAERAVDANVAGGAGAIKIFASGNAPDSSMEAGVMRFAVERAHAAGKQVFVHVNTAGDVSQAVACGADVVAHTTPRTPWTGATLAPVRGSSAALIPTLQLWSDFARHDRLSAQRAAITEATTQLREWIACAGEVLFGTDYGATGADPALEYELMQRAGMEFEAILASLTTAPARRFSAQTKPLTIGSPADVAVVDGDPRRDIAVLTRLRYTLRAGRVIYAT